MKRALTYLFTVACLLCAARPRDGYAQVKLIERNALLAAINSSAAHHSPIVYVGKIPASKSQEKLVRKLRNGKFSEFAKDSVLEDPLTGEVTVYGHPIDSLILSQNEKDYIIQKLGTATTWQSHLFDSSIWVTDLKKGFAAHAKHRSGFGYRYVFSFTKPLFIRNGSVCLITLTALCGGGCGHYDTSFYKFDGRDWKKWITLAGGDF